MNPELKPIDILAFDTLFVNTQNTLPPEVVKTNDGKKIKITQSQELSSHDIVVITLLGKKIPKTLYSDSFLLPFNPQEIQSRFSKFKELKGINVDNVIGKLWIYTRKLVLLTLAHQHDVEGLKEEKTWLLKASACTWESIINIYNYKYSNTTLKEEPPFQIVFTNRQAQALAKLANKINRHVIVFDY